MKKIFILMVLIGGMAVSNLHAGSIFWFNGDGSSEPLLDPSGAPLGYPSTNWLMQMYESTDGVIDFTNGVQGADETLRYQIGFFDGGAYDNGFFYTSAPTNNLLAGDKVFSVIYNSTSVVNATMYAIMDNTMAVVAYDGPGNWAYDTTGVVLGNWRAIPEPMSLGLFGIGVLVVGLRRRLFRK